jgi:hypothetical protein
MSKSRFLQIGFALAALFVLLVGVLTIRATSGQAAAAPGIPGQPTVARADKADTMPRPLRDIPPRITQSNQQDNENPLVKRHDPGFPSLKNAVDPVIQSKLGPLAMPTPIQNFEGEYNEYGPIPPDTNGDVGRNHYIGIVNSGFTVYSKTGTVLYGPTNNNVLFTGFGGLCETTNAGDPVALYDSMADRWLLTWFAFTSQSGPTHQCIAVSTGPDPLGSWYRYDFVTNAAGFEDYPHMTLWPDAYYMTTNTFNDGANTAGNFAFNRAKMLRGDPTAEEVVFRLQGDGGMLSTNFEGSNPPPAGSPNYFWEWYNTSPGQIAEFKFHVDFATPLLSTFTGPFILSVPDFVYPVCAASRERCVPQPGTTAALEVIGDRLMYRVEYRNFGSYESVVLNHTVNASGVAAPRWYEFRAPNGVTGATLFQSGTYAPADGLYRWMGSIAQDRAGDIAMGFSVSSATLFPSIRYAGRIPSDPPGTFGQGEATLLAGTGSEDFPAAPRWGDYSSMSVDPVDDCTFWYTQEYFSVTGLRDWRTRIGSFKFPGCTAQGTPTPVASPTAPAPTDTPVLPTPTECPGGITATGSITNTDPTQTGRLGLGDPKSSCVVPKSVSGLSDSLTRHYDSYTYTNSSGGPECVLVSLTQSCGNNAIQSVAYLGSFDPANIQTNYLADGGGSGHDFTYSFILAPGQTAVVVVLEVSPNLGCSTYTITINPCSTNILTPSPTATLTIAPVASETPTACTVSFTDVPPGSTFYTFIRCLACKGLVNGYPDGTFRPNRDVTRGQLSKIVANAAGFSDTPTGQQFEDVPPGSTFYVYIYRLASKGFINGYPCGAPPAGPCIPPGNLPYFLPNANSTRGQISKIVSNAAGFHDNPSGQQFQDVPVGSTFYLYIYRLSSRGVMSGYPCGTPPAGACVPPGNLPYFLPNKNATRGQTSKIVANTFFPGCNPREGVKR